MPFRSLIFKRPQPPWVQGVATISYPHLHQFFLVSLVLLLSFPQNKYFLKAYFLNEQPVPLVINSIQQ